MAWATKYRLEYKDIEGIDWKVDIEEDGATSVTTLIGADDPLTIEWENNSDDIFEPIKTSRADIRVYSSTNFALQDLYSTEEQQFRVSVYQNDVLYWRGFVSNDRYEEPYDDTPYPVTITAVDGLTLIKDYVYKYTTSTVDDTFFEGRRQENDIIFDILGKFGVTTFTEYVNIYEESMTDGYGDSPIDQLKIDVDVFRTGNTAMYCDEVLEHILKKYNACIIQKGGAYYIYRPTDLKDLFVYGRTLTVAVGAKTTSIFTPAQYINRSSHPTNIQQVPGGVLMIQAPAKRVNINQDYGYKESWLDNWKVEGSRWTSVPLTSWTAEGWETVVISYPGFTPVYLNSPGESDGFVITAHNSYPTLGSYVKNTFGTYAIEDADDVFGLEFEYQWINKDGTARAGQVFYFSVETLDGVDGLEETGDNTTLEWNTSWSEIAITEDVAEGYSGWKSYKRQFIGLPQNGTFIIKFYALDDNYTSIYISVKNVRFFGSSDKVVVKTQKRKFRQRIEKTAFLTWRLGRKYLTNTFINNVDEIVENTYTKTNAINGKELDYDYILGDVTDGGITNILEQYSGALATGVFSLAVVATKFVNDHAADYTAGGVLVTASGNKIVFTSDTAGVNFTGSTTITNTAGDLDGSVATVQANVVNTARVDKIEFTGTVGGTANIVCSGLSKVMTFNDASLTATRDDFVTANVAAYAAHPYHIDLTAGPGNEEIRFTAQVAGTDFTGATSITQTNPTLSGTVTTVTPNATAKARIDEITLTGSSGTADILCDGVTKEAAFESLDFTTDWNTLGGSESKELLEIIGDEIAEQYSRPKQFIQMAIQDKGTGVSEVDILGNFQDDLNTVGGVNRKFVFNRGTFNTKYRRWEIDLMEVI